jgi:hypothetical protein
MKVLITGSRHYRDRSTILHWLTLFPISLVIHGDCSGADQLASDICDELGIPHTTFTADWSQGKKAGPLRNQAMIDSKPDLVIAFPLEDSRGTRDCIRRAKAKGIAVLEIPPGTVVPKKEVAK